MQQSGGNTDVLLFRYFGYKRTLRTFKYVKNKGFFIENNEFKNLYLKWHVQRSGVPMRKKKKKILPIRYADMKIFLKVNL